MLHLLFTMGCKLFICNCDGVTVRHIAHDQRRTSHATLLYKLLTRASLPQLQSTSSITSATCPLMPASCSVASLLLHYVTCGGGSANATRHSSQVARHTSHITYDTSHFTRHTSPVTCSTAPLAAQQCRAGTGSRRALWFPLTTEPTCTRAPRRRMT